MYWLLVELVTSLKSTHKEALRKLLLCEDYNDLTSPTSNQLPASLVLFYMSLLKDKYPNFEVGLKCILIVNPYLLLCSYIN